MSGVREARNIPYKIRKFIIYPAVFFISRGKMFETITPGSHVVAGLFCPPSDRAGNFVSRGLESEI